MTPLTADDIDVYPPQDLPVGAAPFLLDHVMTHGKDGVDLRMSAELVYVCAKDPVEYEEILEMKVGEVNELADEILEKLGAYHDECPFCEGDLE